MNRWTAWQWGIYIAFLLMWGVLTAVYGDWSAFFSYWSGY